MKQTYLLFVVFLFLSTSLFGQKILKTESGQRILLIDNGSWRLLSGVESNAKINHEEGTSLESFEAPKQGKYPLTTAQREEIKKSLIHLLSDEAQILVNLEMSKRELETLQSQLEEDTQDDKLKTSLEAQILQTQQGIFEDQKVYKATSRLIFLAHDLLDGKVKNPEKSIALLENDMENLQTASSGMGGVDTGTVELEAKAEVKKKVVAIKYPTSFEVVDRFDEEYTKDCEIIFDGFDEAIGERRKEVKTEPFFSYTQDKMKPYFKNDDFLSCDASISKVGKNHYLTLKIRIKSKDANKSYGALFANENVKLELINGNKIYGQIINTDRGKIESYTGHTLYTSIIRFDKADINDLKKTYLDNIGLIWSTGYEEYTIYNVDFLTKQIKCLNQ